MCARDAWKTNWRRRESIPAQVGRVRSNRNPFARIARRLFTERPIGQAPDIPKDANPMSKAGMGGRLVFFQVGATRPVGGMGYYSRNDRRWRTGDVRPVEGVEAQ